MNEKDELEIERIIYKSNNVVRDVYEWIIADRKRIVEPLVKTMSKRIDDNATYDAIQETLHLALGEDKELR